jgi:uncharacterized protein YggE
MRTKIVFITFVLIVATLLSGCVGPATTPAAQPHTLNVNGSAQVMLTPDIAYISIGVHTEAKDATEAVASNNSKSQAVVDALQGQGVDVKDIRTTNFSIYPMDQYNPTTGEKTGTVFAVDNTVYVTLRDLSKVGAILDAAIAAGANSVYGISFDVENKDAALAEARAKAVENARAQAEQLAQAAGVTLGAIQSISYYNSSPVPMYYDNKGIGGGDRANASVPISAGQLTITVDVSVSYEIK